MNEEPSMKEKVDLLYEAINKSNKKKIKLPRKAKVRKGKLKKGWVGILKIDENGNISGEKQQIEDSTIKLKDGTYHATDGREVLFWEGKYPIIVQEVTQENPINFLDKENRTYGQKYIMAKMLKDAIIKKKGGGSLILYILVGAGIIYGLLYLFGVV